MYKKRSIFREEQIEFVTIKTKKEIAGEEEEEEEEEEV